MPQQPIKMTDRPQGWRNEDETRFKQWYAEAAKAGDLDPDPDNPLHKYNYRFAFKAGAWPDADKHWPSEFKQADHPNRYVNGQDTTQSGQQTGPSPDEQRAIVQRMIDAGESEENIATVIQHFKTTTKPEAPESLTHRPFDSFFKGAESLGRGISDLAIGGAKGAASTVLGASQLINRTLGTGPSEEVWNRARQDFTTPTNTAQSIGKFGEQVAENFVPAGAISKAVKAAGPVTQAALKLGAKGTRAAEVLTRAGAEAATGAAIHSAQTGSTEGAKGVAASAAGLTGAAKVGGKALGWLGQRVENALIKASKADVENGFKVGSVYKHGLGGTIEQTLQKSDAKLKELGTELKAELAKVGPGGTKPMIDVLGVISDAEKELASKAARNTGQNEAIARAIQSIKTDITTQSSNKLFPGMVDLSDAQAIKQGIGDYGAWVFGRTDPDSTAKELVSNTIYRKLRTAIEGAAPNPGRIQELNKAMSEIIPVRQAIMRRIPVEQRANVLNLGDLIGFGTGAWVLPVLNRVVRSGQFANMAVKSGDKLTNATGVGTVGAAGASQVIRR